MKTLLTKPASGGIPASEGRDRCAELGGCGTDRKKWRCWRRAPLVDIRCPHGERHRRNLEAKTRQDQHCSNQHQRIAIVYTGLDRVGNADQVRCPRQTVEQSKAVKQYG